MNTENPTDEYELDTAVSELLKEPIDHDAVSRVRDRALLMSDDVAISRENRTASNPSPWLRVGGLVGTIAATLLFAVWISNLSASKAIAQVVEHVIQIQGIQFAFQIEHFDEVTQMGKTKIRNDVMRIENTTAGQTIVSIIDTKQGEALVMDESLKLSQRLSNQQLPELRGINPIEELVAAKNKSFRKLGNDRIANRIVEGYRIRGLSVMGMSGQAEMTLWVDSESQLPVKIEMLNADPKRKTRIVFDQFSWNPELPNEDFALNPPQGFSTGEVIRFPESDSKPAIESQDISQGILYSGRVPARIEYDPTAETLTALLREPENSNRPRPNEIRQWNLATGVLNWTAQVGGAGDFAICPSKSLLANVVGQEIQLRSLATGKIVRTWASKHILGPVAFDADGRHLAHGYTVWSRPADKTPPKGGVEIWDVASARLEHEVVDIERVDSLLYSPNGKSLLVNSADGKCRLFRSETGELEYSLLGRAATFSPDGERLALVSPKAPSDKRIGLVDLVELKSKRVVKSFAADSGPENSYLLTLSFSADGRKLAAGDWNGVITVWDVNSGKNLMTGSPSNKGVHSVRFTSTSQLASGSEDSKLTLHRLE